MKNKLNSISPEAPFLSKGVMSKRKFDDIAENNYSGNKMAKISADNSADACLQNINDDIAYIIVDFLKLSATSLSALSLTCSRWHNQIDTILNKDLQRFLPMSYKKFSKKRRNEVVESFTLLRSEASVDLQLFEFPRIEVEAGAYRYFCIGRISHMNAIPWAPHITFVRIHGGYVIVDLNKCQYVVQEKVPKLWPQNARCQLCVINEKRKQVVISSTVRNERYSQDNNLPEYYEWLNVYNVDDNGTVEFVTKFCVHNGAYDYETGGYAPLNIYLDSNGIIWHSRINEVKRFSIDENEEIETNFELNGLYVIGIGEIDNNVVLFCYDYKEGSVRMSIFDTSLKEFSGELPKSDSFMARVRNQWYEPNMKHLKVTVRNNLLIVTDEEYYDESIIYSAKPVIQILDCGANEYIIVSPTGNKVAKLIDDTYQVGDLSRVEIYLREGDQFNLIESHDGDTQHEDVSYRHFWIDDDALLQTRRTSFWVLDEKSPKIYTNQLPFKKIDICDCVVTIVGKTVLIADVVGKYRQSLSIYRMKML